MNGNIFGQLLRVRVEASGDTLAGFGRRIGFSRQRMAELCRRAMPPRVETTLRLAEGLKCDPSELDPRLDDGKLPLPGSRTHAAAKILESRFKLRIEFVSTTGGYYMVCREPGQEPTEAPTAIVAGPNGDGEWGCLAETNLQKRVLAALNGHC